MATVAREVVLPPAIADKIPRLYGTEYNPNPVVWVKLFFPDFNWEWYVVELDESGDLCFGLVNGFEVELGYFLLSELLEESGPTGLKIERDEDFEPCRLRALQESLRLKRLVG